MIDWASGAFSCPDTRLWHKREKLMLARKLKLDQGNFRSPVALRTAHVLGK
jgi:hypothetical protein